MVFNLAFANNAFLSCLFFFLLIVDLYFLIPTVIAKIFNSTAALLMPIGMATKEAKAEIETHPVTPEATICKC